jgi:hypothetical protein
MADVTPPVGLASFAAAAISKADPMKTGFQAFFYSIRTALLPFLFIFNTDLLLINVGPVQAVFVFLVAMSAMLLFAAGTMGWFMTRSKLWESLMLVLIAFMLFRPGFFLNQITPEFTERPVSELYQLAESGADGTSIRVRLLGENINGDVIDARYLLPLGDAGGDGASRLLQSAGIEFRDEDGRVFVDDLAFSGPADALGLDFDWELVSLDVKADRPRKEWFYIPAFILLGFIYLLQMRRKGRDENEQEGVAA